MFGKKKIKIVGLDIGSRMLKVGEIDDTKKGKVLKKFGMIELEPGMIEDGQIKNLEGVAEGIRDLFKTYRIKEPNVAISIGGYSIIIKTITVQTMEEKQLQETINFEAEQYIPFDIQDVYLDYQILGPNTGNPSQMDVLLVAAKKDIVNEYANLVQLAGLNPCIVDVDAFALQNIYESNYQTEGDSVALIDVGTHKTTLNILKGSLSVLIRDVSLGCSQINQRIMELVGCSIDEAEQLYHSSQTEKVSSKEIIESVSTVVSDWCNEIRRALDFYYSTNPTDHIKRIILSGGGANIKKFRQLLAQETASEVELMSPFGSLSIDSSIDPSYLEQISPQAAICMGLAMRRVDDK